MGNYTNSKDVKSLKEKVVFSVIYFVLTLVCIIFSILFLSETNNPFLQKYFIAVAVFLSVILLSVLVFSEWCIFKEKDAISKILLSFFILLAFSSILMFVLQKTGFFYIIKNQESLQDHLTKAGALMPFLYILLQYLQVIILPIPSIISTVAGVALFGAFQACIYSLIGIILGSLTAFYIGRKLGYKAVAWMIGGDTLKKWQKKLKGKDNLLLSLMFILPIFPDDVLCFISGLSSMSDKYFIIMIFISRFISIAATCYSIDFIPLNTWWGGLLWGIFILGVIILFVLIYKNMDKLQRIFKKYFQKRKS